MKNIAPAISPPSGIGNNKPANQAVLDWVHEVELLAKPENIFWCDGSERECDYLLQEAMRLTGLKEKTAVVHAGLHALIKRENARRLIALGGTDPGAGTPGPRTTRRRCERSASLGGGASSIGTIAPSR